MTTLKLGIITHYYDKLGVGILKLDSTIKAGDTISLKNKQDEDVFSQTVESIQKDHQPVKEAKKGDEVGIKLDQPVQKDWQVYSG